MTHPDHRLWVTEFTSPVDGHRYGSALLAGTWQEAQDLCDKRGIGEQVLGELHGYGRCGESPMSLRGLDRTNYIRHRYCGRGHRSHVAYWQHRWLEGPWFAVRAGDLPFAFHTPEQRRFAKRQYHRALRRAGRRVDVVGELSAAAELADDLSW